MPEMNHNDPSQPNKASSIVKKMARLSAYALLAGVVVLILSGWGITQTGIIYRISFGLIDRRLANSIHRAVNAPVAFFFLLHVLLNFRYALAKKIRRRVWLMDGILIAIGVISMGFVIYMEYFRLGG